MIFKVEPEDMGKLRDTRRVKINNMIPNGVEENGDFNFLFLETDCHFREMPRLLELGPEDFTFQTTCKELCISNISEILISS